MVGVVALGYLVTDFLVTTQKDRLRDLKREIATAERTLAALPTWGIELKEYEGGRCWIILPQGVKYITTGMAEKGREALQITGAPKP